MTKLHQLASIKNATRQRRGRGDGSRRGNFSGQGCKGQNSRSGGGVRLGFEGGQSGLLQKIPKLRGFRSRAKKSLAVGLSWLEKTFEAGTTITTKILEEKAYSGKSKSTTGTVKIVANGSLEKKLSIAESVAISKSAKAAVEKAGGTIISEK